MRYVVSINAEDRRPISMAPAPSLERQWVGLGPDACPTLLASLIKADMRSRYDRGERPALADYLEGSPSSATTATGW